MPKKSKGYTPSKSKDNPTAKKAVPFKEPSVREKGLPTQIKAPNSIADMSKPSKLRPLGRPAKLAPRKPFIPK